MSALGRVRAIGAHATSFALNVGSRLGAGRVPLTTAPLALVTASRAGLRVSSGAVLVSVLVRVRAPLVALHLHPRGLLRDLVVGGKGV